MVSGSIIPFFLWYNLHKKTITKGTKLKTCVYFDWHLKQSNLKAISFSMLEEKEFLENFMDAQTDIRYFQIRSSLATKKNFQFFFQPDLILINFIILCKLELYKVFGVFPCLLVDQSTPSLNFEMHKNKVRGYYF